MEYVLQFGDVVRFWPLIAHGALVTVELTVAAIVGGFAIGLSGAVLSISGIKSLRVMVACYVELTRNTPLLVQIFFTFFALPSLGLRLSPMEAAFIALAWNNGAYMTEILRAGLLGVHRSQIEAAECLGMSPFHVFFYIRLPPAIRTVYPAIVGQFMIIFLNSSATSTIGVEDLTGVAGFVQSETLRAFETYIMISLIYICLGFVIRFIFFVASPERTWKLWLARQYPVLAYRSDASRVTGAEGTRQSINPSNP